MVSLETLEDLMPLEIKLLLDNKVNLENQIDQEIKGASRDVGRPEPLGEAG